ncbi:MAG: hypothetical protein DHS20C05_02070 [Hyphococcus sp.]|nr:MAG: hypothetical protein DHS20C05_02070 [Marinicaulis sp.]
MTSNNPTADIIDMEDERARRHASELPGENYVHAGAHLTAVREASGLTLHDAASKIHIKENHLFAIEEMDMSGLPARPYAIGFVKSYAEFLGLDGAAIVDRFKEDAGFSAPLPVEVEKFEAAETAVEADKGELSLFAVIGIILFFLWCAYQITLIDSEKAVGAPIIAPTSEDAVSAGALAEEEPQEVIEAVILERVEPVFPRSCMSSARADETVQIVFNINAAGRVYGERVGQSTNACFDAAALNAIRRWRFETTRVEGASMAAYDQKTVFLFQRPR